MTGRRMVLIVALGLCSLLCGCGGEETRTVPPDSAFNQMPLSLARPFFDAGYALVGYYELDVDGDGVVEVLAVLTVETQATYSFPGGAVVLLFGQRGGLWVRADDWKLNGVNASAELHDLTGDGFPELLVSTEETDRQRGDFVTPLRYTDHLSVFTCTPNLYLIELGVFSSSLAGATRSRSTVGEWGGQPAIQTVQDLPPTGIPLWQPVRVETFVWDGQQFASVQVEERRRVSPIVSWVVRRNAPWAASSLALGGVVSLIVIVVARRLHWRERRVVLGLGLLLVAGGVGLGLAVEWLCVPALVAVGLAGLGAGRQVARLVVKIPPDSEVKLGRKREE